MEGFAARRATETHICRRWIVAELAGRALVTADRASKIHDRRMTFMKKLQKFRHLQEIFTPGAARAVAREEAGRKEDAPALKAEEVKLWMPSDLSPWEQKNGCQRGLLAIEAALREGQCRNSLASVRSHLHAKRHLIGFRDMHITGQIKATKARTLIAQVGERVTANAERYRQGRQALHNLIDESGHSYLEPLVSFRELKASDLTLDNEAEESDTSARKKLALLGSGKGARTPRHVKGSSKRVLTWIWTGEGASDDEEKDLHACKSFNNGQRLDADGAF